MLTLKYDRIDFFNKRIYTEDSKTNYNRDDLKRAFLQFGKTNNATVQIEETVIFWGCLTEYENRIATVRKFDGINYTETKASFDKVKKECYSGI